MQNARNMEEELSHVSNLALAMNATMTAWEKALVGFAAKVFSGEPEGNSLLQDFMAGGALIPGGVPRGSPQPKILNVDEMKDLAKRALFMYMIPTAWKNNKDANVAILDTGRACGDFSDYDHHVPTSIAEQVEICFDSKQYLFLAAVGDFVTCWSWNAGPGSTCTPNDWSAPPGFEHLAEFGVAYKDIMNA